MEGSRTPLTRRRRTLLSFRAVIATMCVLLAVFVASLWWCLIWTCGHHWGFIKWGGIAFGRHPRAQGPLRVDLIHYIQPRPSDWWFQCQAWPPNWHFQYDPATDILASCFVIPLWLPLVALVLLAWALRKRSQPVPLGSCENCGYNLTGNTSGTCPECGNTI